MALRDWTEQQLRTRLAEHKTTLARDRLSGDERIVITNAAANVEQEIARREDEALTQRAIAEQQEGIADYFSQFDEATDDE